jgi:hypothetical protein
MNSAQEIRQELKKLNITNKQVSVRSDSSSINLKVKDLTVDIDALKNIGKKHESISYCEYSQEILSGGNTFVFVSYDWEFERDLKETAEYKTLKAEIEPKLLAITDNSGVELRDGFVAFRSNYTGGFQISAKYTDSPWIQLHAVDGVVFELLRAIKQNKIQ